MCSMQCLFCAAFTLQTARWHYSIPSSANRLPRDSPSDTAESETLQPAPSVHRAPVWVHFGSHSKKDNTRSLFILWQFYRNEKIHNLSPCLQYRDISGYIVSPDSCQYKALLINTSYLGCNLDFGAQIRFSTGCTEQIRNYSVVNSVCGGKQSPARQMHRASPRAAHLLTCVQCENHPAPLH